MCDLIKEFKEKISSYDKYSFLIKDHARVRANQRKINLNKVMDEIIENKTLINIEKQSINKYLVIYQEKHKPKYGYVVEFAETAPKTFPFPPLKFETKREKFVPELFDL